MDSYSSTHHTRRTAFVFAGGGGLGAVQVGMLKALTRIKVMPDFIVGASVGAILGRRDHLVAAEFLRSLLEAELPCQSLETARVPDSSVGSIIAALAQTERPARSRHSCRAVASRARRTSRTFA